MVVGHRGDWLSLMTGEMGKSFALSARRRSRQIRGFLREPNATTLSRVGERLRASPSSSSRAGSWRHVGRRRTAVEITQQHEQAAHEWRIGHRCGRSSGIAQLADDPREGHAAIHAVGLGALGIRQRLTFTRLSTTAASRSCGSGMIP